MACLIALALAADKVLRPCSVLTARLRDRFQKLFSNPAYVAKASHEHSSRLSGWLSESLLLSAAVEIASIPSN